LVGLGIGLLANIVHLSDVIVYGFILCVGALVLVAMGSRRGLGLWVPVFYLVFMLPLPRFLYWPLSVKLQLLSSKIGVALIAALGIPVYLDGNIIDLGNYTLQVAEACSGLRYLFPLMSFGFLFAVLYKGRPWHKAMLFLSTLPITVLMNSVRIGVIGILVDRYGIAQAQGFLHFFEGWVIFVACVAVLYLEAVLLRRLTRNPQPVHKMLEIDLSGAAGQLRHLRHLQPTGGLIFASVVIVLAAIGWQMMPEWAAIVPKRDPLVLFPAKIGEWHGQQLVLDPVIEQVLGATDYLNVEYADATTDAGWVNLFIAYYDSLIDGGIHSPQNCLPAGGWEVSGWSTATTPVKTLSGLPLVVNRAMIQKDGDRDLVYFWFAERGSTLTNDYAAKMATLWDAVTRRRTDGALVRVITPIRKGEDLASADNRLQKFLEIAQPNFSKYIPE
jgi:exosortase D (VPLPA-CTERM-specific)